MLKKIGIDELTVGMYVEKVDRSWLEIPYFRKHIQSSDQIETLRKFNVQVLHIDTDRSTPEEATSDGERPAKTSGAPRGDEATPVGEAKPGGREGIFDAEKVQVCRAFQKRAVQCVKKAFAALAANEPPDMEDAGVVVEGLIDHMARDTAILTTLAKLKAYDDYTFTHSVNVTIFSLIIGKALQYTRSDLTKLGLGAMFHDIGKTRISNDILNQPRRLEPHEMAQVQKHPLFSLELLREVTGMSVHSLRVSLEHHERVSGKGYPRGLKGANISEFGMISSIADVYDAMTTDRVYQKKAQPHSALARIYAMAKEDFNVGFVERFIARLGFYPIGSVVILTSGEVGIVTETHLDHLLCPVVMLLLDRTGQRLRSPDFVDLLYDREKRRVKSVAGPSQYDLSVQDLLQLG